MLVEFSVGNFWSFKEIQTLQMQAAKIKSKFPKVDKENVFVVNDKLSLLKSKAIYGANASGKSNLIRAMVNALVIFRDCVTDEKILSKRISSFKFNVGTLGEPSFFQIVFIVGDTQFRYGFEANANEIVSEWLFGRPLEGGRIVELEYFTRVGLDVKVNKHKFKEGVKFSKLNDEDTPLYRENTLFLRVVAAWSGKLSRQIMEFFQEKIALISGLSDTFAGLALRSMSNEGFKDKASLMLKAIDRTIKQIERVEIDIDPDLDDDGDEEKAEFLQKIKDSKLKLGDLAIYRDTYDEQGNIIGQNHIFLRSQEAEGTKKLFNLSPILFDVLQKGATLFIDEFDARMHPRLSRKIIELFHDNSTNPNNAQLIFVTHDSTLLDAKLLRRDQISFVKKDKFGASTLYSLVEFKGVRNDASFEKDYLLGKYDAVPNNLNALEEAIQSQVSHAETN